MGNKGCPQENTVARTARTGMWDEATTKHARECAFCREVSAAAVRMQSIATFPEPSTSLGKSVSAPLPEAGLLWWKHELMERYAARERATRPVRIMEIFTGAMGLLALLAVIVIVGLMLPDAIKSAAEQGSSQLLASALTGSFSINPDTLLTGTVLIALLCAALLYPLWREQ